MIVMHELASGGLRGLSMPYNKHWRTWRKVSTHLLSLPPQKLISLLAQIQDLGMNIKAAPAYREHQALESTLVLRGMLESPEHYKEHLTLYVQQ